MNDESTIDYAAIIFAKKQFFRNIALSYMDVDPTSDRVPSRPRLRL